MTWESTQTLDAWLAAERDGLRALARALLRSDADAEDCVQEASLAALRASGTRNRPAWMRTVVRRLAFRRHREVARRRRREEQVARPEGVPSAAESAERMEVRRQVLAAAGALADPYRITIALRYFEGLSPGQIAVAHGVPVATVKTRLNRGLAMLRETLDRAHDGRRAAWAPLLAFAGGSLVAKKAMAVGVVVLLLAGVAWLGLGQSLPEREREAPVGAATESTRSAPALAGAGGETAKESLLARTSLREEDPVPEETFAGRVVDASGNGVKDAVVRLHWVGVRPGTSEAMNGTHLVLRREGERREQPATRTDAAGYFRLDRPYASTSYLGVEAPGFTTRVTGPHPSGTFILVRLDVGGGLEVHVTRDAGVPVAGAEVRLVTRATPRQFPSLPRQILATTRTGADGRAALPASPGRLGLEVVPAEPELGLAEILLEAPAEAIEVRLPSVKVEERCILDAQTGSPVIDGWVDVLASHDSYVTWESERHRRRVFADHAGVVRFPWQEGYYSAYASGPGYEVVHAWEDPIRLPRAMQIEGSVFDEEGKPVAGAPIFVVIPDSGWGGLEPAEIGRSPVAAWSDESGAYALDVVLPHAPFGKEPPDRGMRSLLALHPDVRAGHAAAMEDGIRIVPGGRERVDLRFPRPGAVSVTVLDAEDKPIAGQWISVRRLLPRAETWPVPDRPFGVDTLALARSVPTATTDGSGRVRVGGLTPGRHLVYAENTRTEADVREGETTDVRLVMGTGPGIRGRVVDADGTPLGGARVGLGGKAAATRVTDDEGRFAFFDLPDGDYGLSVIPERGRLGASKRARPGDDVTLRIPAGPARLRIRLDGPPVGSAEYSLFTETGGAVPSGTGFTPLPSDDFETPPFDPGVGVLVVQAKGYGWTAVRFEAPEARTSEVRVTLPRAATLQVRLSAPLRAQEPDPRRALTRLARADGYLEGVVGGEDLNTVLGGVNRLAYAIQRSRGSVHEHARPAEDGAVHFPDVAPGAYDVSYGHYEEGGTWTAGAARRVEVRSGESVVVDLP